MCSVLYTNDIIAYSGSSAARRRSFHPHHEICVFTDRRLILSAD